MGNDKSGEKQTEQGENGTGVTSDSKNTLLGRRNLLKATGVGLVSMVGLSQSAFADSNYKTVKVDAGENWFYRLDDGETLENVLFDCTASDTRVSIKATGENWTIRNIGIKGVHDQSGGHAVFALEAAGGTECRVENLWMGDGSSVYDGAGSSETAVWVSPESSGPITFRHCYFDGWKDNAIYASSPGREGNGAITIDSCYAANNNHADYRIGSTGSVIKNSVVEHTRSGSGIRGVWCWYNDGLEIRNCDIDVNGYGAAIHAGPESPGGVTVYDSELSGALVENGRGNGSITLASGNGDSPDTSVPDGVPSSPEEAASGTSAQSGDSKKKDEVAIITTPEAGGFDYEITVTGDAFRETLGETPSGNEIHDGKAAEYAEQTEDGWLFGGTLGDGYGHGFMVEGEVVGVEVTDWDTGEDPIADYWVERNGECIIACGDDTQPEVSELALIAEPEASGFDYEFEVKGNATREALGETPSGNPIHAGKAAEYAEQTEDGWIFGGTLGDGYGHGFNIEGEIVRFEASDWETGEDPTQDYWVERDGECIIACGKECSTDAERGNTIVIDGTETDSLTHYVFSVSGSIEREPDLTSVEDGGLPWDSMEDKLSEDTAIGVIGQGTDGYRFSGEITDRQVYGDAEVSVTVNDCQ